MDSKPIHHHLHHHLSLLFAFLYGLNAVDIPISHYYDQCSPSKCGRSLLQFPFGENPLCKSIYMTPSCENHTVFIIDKENPQLKYKLLQDLNNTVYTQKSITIVDVSLFGCDQIPTFPKNIYRTQDMFKFDELRISEQFKTGTLLNCTEELNLSALRRLRRAPCLECEQTPFFCYFYDGYGNNLPYCRSFRAAIPIDAYNNLRNLSGDGDLRRVLQGGFRVDWNDDCNACTQSTGGRCGYLDERDQSNHEQVCFCNSGVHRNNCFDGFVIRGDNMGSRPSTVIKTIAGTAIGAALLLVGILCIYIHMRSKRMKTDENEKDEESLRRYLDEKKTQTSIEQFLHNYASGMLTRFSYRQIKKYSNNFSQKLGQGGFGSVYKGELQNGYPMAIKVLEETEQSEAQFLNEVRTLGQIHHNNLVRMLGFCFQESRRALIYEFMPNGSLEKYIHRKNRNPSEKLTWNQLQEIATGTAKGIVYLHEECRSRILHCDIKPHNILLDEKFQPKVSDFGLAQTVNREKSHVSLTCGRGTPGYAPPEMWCENYGPVTEKSDVYSYGMVVLEMVGERRNFEEEVSKSSETYFPEWAFLHHVAEENGGGFGSKWHLCEDEEEEKIARRMELVGLWCIQYQPARRPTMRKVVEMLEGNVQIHIPPIPFCTTVSSDGFRLEAMEGTQYFSG